MSGKPAVGGPVARFMTLDEAAAREPAIAGNKAAQLAVLRQAGFRVPPGIVIAAVDPETAGEPLPGDLRRALLSEVTDRLGSGPWSVRSSSTVEDNEHASFAGQFETFLNVEARDLLRAVTACVGSANTSRVETYRGHQAAGSMAVLIQPMIAARVAGVAFTLDPVSGRPHTIIEAVAGLGERLVSGEASPERWVIADDGSIDAPSQVGVLDHARAQAIGALARRVEQHRRCPQDIEWAIDGSTLWLLQARPITTVRKPAAELVPVPIEVPPGVWMRDDFHEPVPMSQFARVIFTEQIVNAMPLAFANFGVLIDRLEVVIVGGWTYSRPIPLEPAAIRARKAAAETAIASDLALKVTRRWFDQWRPEYIAEARSALALDLRSVSDDELAAHLDQRVKFIGRPDHTMVGIAWFLLIHDLVATCEELLGWDTARTLSLLAGLSVTSILPAKQMAELAQLAKSTPAIGQLLANVDETTPSKLAGVDPAFADAFARYLESTAHRAVRFDVLDPNLAERPHLLLRLVADQMTSGFSPEQATGLAQRRRDEAVDEARAALASRAKTDLDRFEQALARAREAYPAMEDKTWHTQAVQTALVRYLGLEIGRRLVDRGQLVGDEDVFLLEVHEARSALFDGADQRETARLRTSQRAWAMANPGPLVYGDPPPEEPPFHLLPPAARRVNEAVAWGFAEFLRHHPGATKPGQIKGTPASSGRYRGPVRVVMGEHEFGKIRTGDVVISPTTSPVWSIVFPALGALVTDAGGILSHAAIIAREHGIPAVVGAGHATKVLKDGQFVTVNGDTGEVEL